LDLASGRWNFVDSQLSQARQLTMSAGQQVSDASQAQASAALDDALRDSSAEGRALLRDLSSGEGSVDHSRHRGRQAMARLSLLQADFHLGESELDGLIADLQKSGDARLPLVLEARYGVDLAREGFETVHDCGQEFLFSAAGALDGFREGRDPASEIRGDRPGLNIQQAATEVGQSLLSIHHDLLRMDAALSDANLHGDQASSQLADSARGLRRLAD
jgi:hypothetical protein